jgi:hypothetical protein
MYYRFLFPKIKFTQMDWILSVVLMVLTMFILGIYVKI